MTYDTTYIVLPLKRCGLWDEALAILPSDATALRAELLTDRFWWRLDGQAEAEQAVAALREEDGLLAAFLAEALPPESTERGHLLQTAAATARELNLAWLKSALDR